jgi:hypothetical protein
MTDRDHSRCEPENPFAGHPRFDRITAPEGARPLNSQWGSNLNPWVAPVPGRKDDTAKLDMTLLFDDMPHALEGVVEVLQWAVTKKQPVPYQRGSWQAVEPFQARYRAAQLRHQINAAKEAIAHPEDVREFATDGETGLLELAHIATGALFQLEMALRKKRGLL